MHSPFVFDFILHVLNNKKNYTAPGELEDLRKKYISDKERLTVVDLGAGSRSGTSREKIKKMKGVDIQKLGPIDWSIPRSGDGFMTKNRERM